MELHLVQREYDVAHAVQHDGELPRREREDAHHGRRRHELEAGLGREARRRHARDDGSDPRRRDPLGHDRHRVARVQQNTDIKAILASQLDNQGPAAPDGLLALLRDPERADHEGGLPRRHRRAEAPLERDEPVDGFDQSGPRSPHVLPHVPPPQGAGGWVTKTWRDEDRGGGERRRGGVLGLGAHGVRRGSQDRLHNLERLRRTSSSTSSASGAPFTGTIPQAIVDIATILSPFEGTRFSPHGKAYRQLWEDGMSLLRDLARDREARLPSGASQPIATGEGWVDAPAPLFGAATVSAESDPSGSSGGGFSGF
jgi:hypothetical protein